MATDNRGLRFSRPATFEMRKYVRDILIVGCPSVPHHTDLPLHPFSLRLFFADSCYDKQDFVRHMTFTWVKIWLKTIYSRYDLLDDLCEFLNECVDACLPACPSRPKGSAQTPNIQCVRNPAVMK